MQWRWSWFDNPVTFRDRFAAVPRDLVLPDGETALIAADDDEAVVARSIEVIRRGAHLELSSPGPQSVTVQLSSRRGVTSYDVEWVGSAG